MFIDKLGVADIEQWFAGRNEALTTRKSNMGRLGSMFDVCFRRSYIKDNPMLRMSSPKIEGKPAERFTPDEAKKLLRAAGRAETYRRLLSAMPAQRRRQGGADAGQLRPYSRNQLHDTRGGKELQGILGPHPSRSEGKQIMNKSRPDTALAILEQAGGSLGLEPLAGSKTPDLTISTHVSDPASIIPDPKPTMTIARNAKAC